MVWIPGDSFPIGSEDSTFTDAQPVHTVRVKGFWMDAHEVTNAEYQKFVQASGYVTVADYPLDPRDFPGADPANLKPGSIVFSPPAHPVGLGDSCSGGPTCRVPTGAIRWARKATWKEKKDYPWCTLLTRMPKPMRNGPASGCLPKPSGSTPHGKAIQKYYWGDVLKTNGRWVANIYQGSFPDHDQAEDGFAGACSRAAIFGQCLRTL